MKIYKEKRIEDGTGRNGGEKDGLENGLKESSKRKGKEIM